MSIETFPITVEKVFMLTPTTKHFIFRCASPTPFHYVAGQFITIHFEHDNKPLRRSYSIANVPLQNNSIEIAASFVDGGPGSELLFNLNIGDTLHASGPYGRLVLKETIPQRYILIATSTGITPYRAMLADLIQRIEKKPDLQIVIVEGVQNRNAILYENEFKALMTQYPQVTFHACLSREDKTMLTSPNEHAGYVQQLLPNLNLNPEEDQVYLCGNPMMIDDVYSLLKERGFTTQNIIREKYISR